MNKDEVYTAVTKDTAWISVRGRGTFQISHPIKRWLLSKLQEGYSNIIVDLGDCITMDSTFMGVFTGLSLRLIRLGKTPLILANITAHNKRLLETLGLDKFLDLKESYQIDTPLGWELLPVESLNKLATTKHMMEAHEELIKTGGVAKEQFKEVHKLLKDNLKKQKKEPPPEDKPSEETETGNQ